MNDLRSYTQSELAKSNIYKRIKSSSDSPDVAYVLSVIDDIVFECHQMSKTILKHMGEYTLHDSEHSFRVLRLMEKIIDNSVLDNMSIPELYLLILSAFIHDIGMAANEQSIQSWYKIWDKDPILDNAKQEEEYALFRRFSLSRPNVMEEIDHLQLNGQNSSASLLKGYLISEYIRQTHSQRAKEIINEKWNGKVKYLNSDLTLELADICFSHSEEATSLGRLEKDYLCGEGEVICLPLIGILLRLADILDFDAKRTPDILYSHLVVKHPVSIKEWNKHRAVEAWKIDKESIVYHAKCEHPAIEATIHQFCDLIDRELSVCNNIMIELNRYNNGIGRNIEVIFPIQVNREKIITKRDLFGNPLYIYQETKFTLSKKQVVELLMGTKLYGKSEVALRELIQNSIDACLLRKDMELNWQNNFEPWIEVKYLTDDEGDYLVVDDNGVGMDQYIIDNYYSQIGSSFYKSSDFFDLKVQSNSEFTPTSRFGIGILSCFMVADSMNVDTRKVYEAHDSSEPINITIEGQESIFWVKEGKRKKPGTTTTLRLRRSKNPWDKMSEDAFIDSVKLLLPNPPVTIEIVTQNRKFIHTENSYTQTQEEIINEMKWEEHSNIGTYKIELNRPDIGILGTVIVGILEKDKLPVKRIETITKNINVDCEYYDLSKEMAIVSNKIEMKSMSLTINDDNEIEEDYSTRYLISSTARISLHGIEIPYDFFKNWYNREKGDVKIDWPMPVKMVIDIGKNRDLDLNTSRTQVLMSEKWLDFEEEVAYQILHGIKNQVTDVYFDKLLNDVLNDVKGACFLRAIYRIGREC